MRLTDEHIDKEITVLDIYKSDKYNDQYIPLVIEVIDLKVKYWEKIINGYQNIQDFADFTVRLSNKLNQLLKRLEIELNASLTGDLNVKQFSRVAQLKLLSLFFAVAANDMQNVRVKSKQGSPL